MIAAPPPVALTASPVRIALSGAARETIRVANPGRLPAVVDAAPAGFALDLRGRPRVVVRRDTSVRVTVRPNRVTLPPGGDALLVVSSSVAPRARAGDHEALVLLTTRPRDRNGVAVRMQLGVVVTVRVAGTLVHRLELLALRVDRRGRRSLLDLTLRNRGNVAEEVGPASLRLELRRAGRVLATLRPVRRRLLPGARGVAEFRRPDRLSGRVTAVVTLSGRGAGGPVVRRVFSIRLSGRRVGRPDRRAAP